MSIRGCTARWYDIACLILVLSFLSGARATARQHLPIPLISGPVAPIVMPPLSDCAQRSPSKPTAVANRVRSDSKGEAVIDLSLSQLPQNAVAAIVAFQIDSESMTSVIFGEATSKTIIIPALHDGVHHLRMVTMGIYQGVGTRQLDSSDSCFTIRASAPAPSDT
jgi:hypothetical protein